jgi:hypothetical protein
MYDKHTLGVLNDIRRNYLQRRIDNGTLYNKMTKPKYFTKISSQKEAKNDNKI